MRRLRRAAGIAALVASVPAWSQSVVYDDPTHTRITLNPGGTATITNLKAGSVSNSSTDAVNGSQLYTTQQDITAVGDTLNQIAGDTSNAYVDGNGRGIRYVRTNEAGLALSDATARGQGATALGYDAAAAGESALAAGRAAQASGLESIAIGRSTAATSRRSASTTSAMRWAASTTTSSRCSSRSTTST